MITSEFNFRSSSFKKSRLHGKHVQPLDQDSDTESLGPSQETETSINTQSSLDELEEFGEESDCKYDDQELLKTKTPLLTGDDVHAKREEIREYFHKTFSLYEKLFTVLASDDTYFMQPEKLRHPLIFYFGHTAVFFINKLRLNGVLNQRINESLESTLAIGVDEMSWDDLNTGNYNWPSVEQVRKYRDVCRVVVDDLISSLPLTLPITWDQPFWTILMGCEHERIHLETSSVLFRQLPIDQVKAVPMWQHCTQFREKVEDVPKNQFLPVPGGKVVTGKSEATQEVYGWDNEYGSFSSEVTAFQASQYLTSNAEFYEFVQDGGYEDESLWGEEGWKFVQFRKATCPVFWVPEEEQPKETDSDATVPASTRRPVHYRYRTMTAVIDMPWDWPVDANYIEAKAFCAWKNRKLEQSGQSTAGKLIRLPTEAEYLRLRDYSFPETETNERGELIKNDQPYWSDAPGNINMEHGASSCPIDHFRFGHGFYDIIGNVWQWSETPIMPFRGFRFHPLYDDFSVPTFDTRHNIFTGGSWASTGNEATRLARYAFRRHFYQHAGFRYILAEPLKNEVATQSMCETDPAVTHMMEAQYNDAGLNKVARSLGMNVQNYSVKIAEYAVQVYKKYGRTPKEPITFSATDGATSLSSSGPRAIDIGCACGRSTFELAKLAAPADANASPLFNHILGLDFSTRFIRIAAQLQFEQHAEYSMKKEGELISYHSIESSRDAQPVEASSSTPAIDCHVSSAPSVVDLDLQSRSMRERVEFMQGDACNLGVKYTNFDLVLASNLLEYLYAPRTFLETIGSRMKSGSILVLSSSYSWDTAFTPRPLWLGGLKDGGGESVESLRAITEILTAAQFESIPEATIELPMLWKQNARNYQLKFVQTTVWRKK